MRPLVVVCLFLLLALHSRHALVLEEYVFAAEFMLGQLHFAKEALSVETVREIARNCVNDDALVDPLIQRLIKHLGTSLLALQQVHEAEKTDTDFSLSISLSHCAAQAQSAESAFARQCLPLSPHITPILLQELVNQLSLLALPANYAVAKNLGFLYECNGHFQPSVSLYRDCFEITQDAGCNLHHTLSVPIVSYSEQATELVYLNILRNAFRTLLRGHQGKLPQVELPKYDSSSSSLSNKPFYDVANNILREIPINAHYLGFSPGRIFELLARSMIAFAPSISASLVPIERASMVRETKVIRVGVVSEHFGNTSPGNCMLSLFQKIAAKSQQKNNLDDSPSRDGDESIEIEFAFFDRAGLNTVFADEMRSLSAETFLINEESVAQSQRVIADAAVDILLYLALPTIKLTQALSLSRLAPVQIQLGLGHPLSSGSPAIDYSVVPWSMYAQSERDVTEREDPTSAVRCATQAYLCEQEIVEDYHQHLVATENAHFARMAERHTHNNESLTPLPARRSLLQECALSPDCHSRSTPAYYTEQVVFFSSLAHTPPSPLLLYEHDPEMTHFMQRASDFLGIHAAFEKQVQEKQLRASHTLKNDSSVGEEPRVQAFDTFSCEELNEMLRAFSLSTRLAAEDIGCISSLNGAFHRPRYRLYHAVQYMKKMHPLMDELLLRILAQDRHARILVPAAFPVVFPRMLRTAEELGLTVSCAEGEDEEDDYEGMCASLSTTKKSVDREPGRRCAFSEEALQRAFIPLERMDHASYLLLVSLSSVFLNTAPYGSGMTSAEALALSVPVLALPHETSVLHFAHSQVRVLSQSRSLQSGAEKSAPLLEELLTARDRVDFAHKAACIAHGAGQFARWSLRERLRRAQHLLFGTEAVEAAAREWRDFLVRAAHS